MRRVLLFFCVLFPSMATAQSLSAPPGPRADVTASVGWVHVPFEHLSTDFFRTDDWTHHAAATGAAGIYWTDHWKTEISFGISNHSTAWDAELVRVGGDLAQRSVTHRVRYTHVSLAQMYQFGRNEWVHPAVGGGLLVQQRRGTSEYSPAVIYRPPSGIPDTVAPFEQRDLAADTVTAPFVVAGLKAYLSPRAFFRTDVQVAFRDDMERVVVHAGFGIDF